MIVFGILGHNRYIVLYQCGTVKFSLDYMKRWLLASRKRYFDWAILVALIFVAFWFVGNIISPYLAPAGTIHLGEDGLTGIVPTGEDNGGQIGQIENSFARSIYHAGDGNCHQHASRSFFLNDNQMPFCARCTAIFFGIVVGVAILMFLIVELNIWGLLLGLMPMGLDGGIQLISQNLYASGTIGFFYESTNLMRFITGSIAGIAAGLALGYIISEIGHMAMVRRDIKKGPK